MQTTLIVMMIANGALAAVMLSKIGGKGTVTVDLEAYRNVYAVIGGFFALNVIVLMAMLPKV